MKPEFLAEMTHELRSPLNTILGFAELMHDGSVGPIADDHKEYLADILTSGRHLLRMIDELLTLAKLEAGREERRVEAIDLRALVDDVRDLVQGRAAHRRTRIDIDVVDVPGLEGDAGRLSQIVLEAMATAVNGTPEGGVITVRGRANGDRAFELIVEGASQGQTTTRFALTLPRLAGAL